MDERGQLIRHAGPDWLRLDSDALANSMGISLSDIGFEGRDGTGPKTEVPWIRFFSRERSPSATIGWYCVYLFDTAGEVAFLSLGHGSTEWTGVDFKPRPTIELTSLADWARGRLSESATRSDLVYSINLHSRRSNLGPSYEAGTVVAIPYHRDSIPAPDELRADAIFMATLLGEIYRAEETVPSPGSVAPEIRELIESAERVAGKRIKGQGFRLSAAQRKVIEDHAMSLARMELTSWGWSEIKDVSAGKSYDFYCRSEDDELFVEVKGTTSGGDSIILTRNEVLLHQECHPNNCLIVVHDIHLAGNGDDVTASGGVLEIQAPWLIEADRLKVVSYVYAMDNINESVV
jgi:hypothetical protein